ncbi:MAG: hypothetical protein GY863_19630 [bacterium]|nr:hypothetical protein [bacterium]
MPAPASFFKPLDPIGLSGLFASKKQQDNIDLNKNSPSGEFVRYALHSASSSYEIKQVSSSSLIIFNNITPEQILNNTINPAFKGNGDNRELCRRPLKGVDTVV